MRVKDSAQQQGISYTTAWRWCKDGKLPGHQLDTGTVLLAGASPSAAEHARRQVAIYARVASAEHTHTLESQAERLVASGSARGDQVAQGVKEIGSGVTDARPHLLALLDDQTMTLLVVEHTDRLSRCGFGSVDTLLKGQGRAVAVVHQAENGTQDVLADLTSIIYSLCARRYGQQRAKRKTDTIVREVEATGEGRDADASG
jgi:predicted site-specific integrase-resolvase